MKKKVVAAAYLLMWFVSAVPSLADDGRERLLFDFGWKFSPGHGSDAARDYGFGLGTAFAKAGEAFGPAAYHFSDSTWRSVDLPHDWAVELPFVYSPDPDLKAHGYKPLGRTYPESSIGWYRRAFTIPVADRGRRITVQFDGVFRDATVWCNGHYLGRHASGYSPFTFDLTDYLRYGQRNILVVRVDASQYEGWFYEGAGIYRHVWLNKFAPLHFTEYGLYAHSQITDGRARVTVATTLENRGETAEQGTVQVELIDPSGRMVSRVEEPFSALAPQRQITLTQHLQVEEPQLWSLEKPQLYTVRTRIRRGEASVDQLETTHGLRTLRFDKDLGFFLNGKPVKIQGVCCHQDHGGVGAALPDGVQEFRIKRLKEMGCNAYRASHNPPTPELLDACDRLGMLVMDENRLMGSTTELLDEWETLIKRDRNHPSVIIWSLGNEEYVIQGEETGRNIARSMLARLALLDPGRTATYGANINPDAGGINTVIPVRGFNYKRIGGIDRYRQLHPDQPLIGTEEGSTVCTRGFYSNDTLKGYVCDYDSMYPSWASTARDWWSFYSERPWLSGGFVWTGFDYRGEPTPYGWPCINSHFGIMDMCGFAKNNFYYYQAWWKEDDLLHLFPHWNWPGREGELMTVWVHSNCDSVELSVNGRPLGRQIMARNGHLQWRVPYAPGRLEARGWRGGREMRRRVETTGAAVRLALTPDKPRLAADQEDVVLVTVTARDEQGREFPTADHLVRFRLEGPGRIIGVANGDPSSHEPDKCLNQPWERRLFSGKAQVIIQSLRQPGEIRLIASSGSLAPATLLLQAEPCTPRPFVPPYQPERVSHLGLSKIVTGKTAYSPRWAAAGDKNLTNGVLGSGEYNDGQWQGYEGVDLEAVIDLGRSQPVTTIQASFLQNTGSWIFWPQSVKFLVSGDGRSFKALPGATFQTDTRSEAIRLYTASGRTAARYIKVQAINIGLCPPGHPGAGGKAWLFVDEVVIR